MKWTIGAAISIYFPFDVCPFYFNFSQKPRLLGEKKDKPAFSYKYCFYFCNSHHISFVFGFFPSFSCPYLRILIVGGMVTEPIMQL